jgi:hypothetical protein
MCAPCQKVIDDEVDAYSDEEDEDDVCRCDFPKFHICDGLQVCRCCGKADHYKNGVVTDWSDTDE